LGAVDAVAGTVEASATVAAVADAEAVTWLLRSVAAAVIPAKNPIPSGID